MSAGLPLVYDDGGRAEAGYRGATSDCVTRAIAIAAQVPYQEVYDAINEAATRERGKRRTGKKSSAREGVYTQTMRRVAASFGGRWVPIMGVGTGTTVHLAVGELPMGRIVARVSKHAVAVIDGLMHDTSDPSREGTRAVYGYWVFGEENA